MPTHPRNALRLTVAVLAGVLLFAGAGSAQPNDCAIVQGSTSVQLPHNTGTMPSSADMAIGASGQYLYALTEWGFVRGDLGSGANPGPFTLLQVGLRQQNGGIIPITCDCFTGGSTMAAAEDPSGHARMISDWVSLGPEGVGGLPGMLGTTASGTPSFGQQVDLPTKVPGGGRVAAVYIASSQKYFGYFPSSSGGVQGADLTNPTGSRYQSDAIVPFSAVSWGSTSTVGARLTAAHMTIPGYDKYLLVGASPTDLKIHVAEINGTTGVATEVASSTVTHFPDQVEVAVVNNEIFIFSAEESSGLQVYQFQPPNVILQAGSIAGDFRRVIVRGPAPFPAIFGHRREPSGITFIDVYNTRWLTDGGTPLRAASIPHLGASDAAYRGNGMEALVTTNGSTVTAYLYREVTSSPEQSIRATTVDISCISADPTAPPIANAILANLSAASRPSPENTKNYFGDKWHLQDASASFAALDSIRWDINLPGGSASSFAPDAAWTGSYAALSNVNPAYWPCEPASGGNLSTGAGCYTSLGSPAGGANFYLGLQSHNVNGYSNTFVSLAQNVLAPQVSIVGYNPSTQILRVLSGGTADATGSQGNTAEAAFNWTFTPGGAATGLNPAVPTNATSFSLIATYKGGYAASASGSIQQVDLVPNYSITSPLPALVNSQIAIKNLMQKGSTTILNYVDWAITTSSVPPSPFPSGQRFTCPSAGFCTVNGTATVPAPGTVGNYYLHLAYNFSGPHGSGQQLTASLPFATTIFQPQPFVGVYRDSAHTQIVPPFGSPPTFSLTAGTTYYLFDDEPLPTGVTHPGSSFFKSTNGNPSVSGDTLIGNSPGAGPVQFTPTACSSNCFLKAQVPQGGTAVGVAGYSASSSGPPPPPPPPSGPSLTLSGPSTGTTAGPVTFTATATNFPGSVTFAWGWGDSGSPPSPPPPGPPPPGGCPPGVGCDIAPGGDLSAWAEATTASSDTQSHTYATPGSYVVSVQATSGSVSLTKTATVAITQGGPPAPSNGYTVSGASQNTFNGTWEVAAGVPVTFSATETQASSFAWDFGDGATATGQTVSHAFSSAGLKTVTLTVTGDGTTTSGTSTASIRFDVSPPSFQAIMIPGAGSILSSGGNWATDLSVTNPGTTSTTVTLYFASFADAIPGDLSTLPFDSVNSFPLGPGESWSGVDIVGNVIKKQGQLQPGAGKGILFLKFQGGNQAPIATSRVYFTAQGASYGTALPSFIVGPYGSTQTQEAHPANGQYLIGLRNDDLYRFNISLFNASSEGGLFHVDAFSEDGSSAGGKDFAVPPYSQAGVNPTDVITALDSSKRYVLKTTGTTGALQAYASALDRRNNDLVQVADDTPVVAAAPNQTVDYFIPGVGRIEDASSNAHWRTDLRFFNTSSLTRTIYLEFRFTPAGGTEQIVLKPLQIGAGQGISIDDVVGNFLNDGSPIDLTTGTALGLLHVYYTAPTDIATAPLKIGGRIYADLPTGTAGMQLSTYTGPQSIAPNAGSLVMPGAQTNLRFRTNIGIFTLGDLPTNVLITAINQDGTVGGTFQYQLNNPGHSGAFAQIPMISGASGTFPNITGDPLAIKVQALDGSPVGAYIVTVDQISADTVFIQGKPVS